MCDAVYASFREYNNINITNLKSTSQLKRRLMEHKNLSINQLLRTWIIDFQQGPSTMRFKYYQFQLFLSPGWEFNYFRGKPAYNKLDLLKFSTSLKTNPNLV